MENKKSLKLLSVIMTVLILIVSLPTYAFASLVEGADEQMTVEGSREVEVLYELEDQREESVKHYMLSDGTTKAVMYGTAVHYKDENGKWIDIDNALNLSGSEYSTKNKQEIKFAKKSGTGSLVSIKDGEYKIDFSPIGADKVRVEIENPEKVNSTKFEDVSSLKQLISRATYEGIYDGIDIEYILVGNNLKENIIINEQVDRSSFSFELSLSKLTARLEGNEILLCDVDSGRTVYTLPAPYMYDASGNQSTAVTYTLTQKSSWKYTLTVTADEEYLATATYPVTIDPMVYVNTSVTDIGVRSDGTKYLADPGLYVGNHTGDTIALAVVRHNQLPTVPQDCTVINAKLALSVEAVFSSSSGINVGVYKLNGAFDTSLTYSTALSLFDISLPVDYINITADGSHSWNITELYNEWTSGVANYGVAVSLINPSVSTYGYICFGSAEGTNAVDPQIEVTYTSMTGLESYYTYFESSAGMAGQGYVNAFTGNLTFVHNIFTTADEILPYSLYLTYNSNKDAWRLSPLESVEPQTINNIQRYKWTDSDGTEHWFSPILKKAYYGNYVMYEYTENGTLTPVNNPTKFYDEDGLGLTLTIENGSYKISDDKGNCKFISSNGITAIIDTYGNRRSFKYTTANGEITGFTIGLVPSGSVKTINQIVCTYTDTGYHISNVQTGVSADITLDEGLVTNILYTYTANATYSVEYEYDTYGKLKYAIDTPASSRIVYAFTGSRVTNVKEAVKATDSEAFIFGNAMSISYGTLSTTVRMPGADNILTNGDDIYTKYQFDYTGKATSVYSFDTSKRIAGSTSYAYYSMYSDDGVDSKTNNSIKYSIVDTGHSVNLLSYPECDSLTGWITSDSHIYIDYPNFETDSLMHYNKALRIGRIAAGTSAIKQGVYLTEGKYNFSASFYKLSMSSTSEIRLRIYGSDGTKIASSESIKKLRNNSSIWERENISFEITQGGGYYVSIEFTTDSSDTQYIFVDDVMLEASEGAGYFSAYGNGGFENGLITANGVNASAVTTKISGSKGLKLTSNLSNVAQYKYTYNVIGGWLPVNLTISAWAKAPDAIASTNCNNSTGTKEGATVNSNVTALFGILLTVNYSNSSKQDSTLIPIDPGNGDWQYISYPVRFEALEGVSETGGTISHIDIYLIYANNAGSAYFDNISLSNGGTRTDYEYNSMGYVTKAGSSDGNESNYEYASNNTDLVRVTDKYGREQAIEYDESNNVSGSSYTSDDTSVSTDYTYNGYGQATGATTTFGGASKKLTVTSSYVTDTQKSSFSNLQRTVDANGNVTEYEYYDNGLLKVINGPEEDVRYFYNDYGELVSAVCGTYSDGGFSGNTSGMYYSYDSAHRLTGIDKGPIIYSNTYNEFGRRSQFRLGLYSYRTLATYEYVSNNGNLKKLTYGNGAYVEYSYDSLGRTVGVCYNGVESAEYVYSASGNVSSITDLENGTEYKYYYSNDGKLINERAVSNGTTKYTRFYEYDEQGRVESVELYTLTAKGLVAKTSQYTYDSDGNVLKIDNGVTLDEDYAYDEYGRQTQVSMYLTSGSTIASKSYEYNDTAEEIRSQIKKEIFTYGSTTKEISYSYNSNGYISSMSIDGDNILYTYDSLGQLVIEVNHHIGKVLYYTYDNYGNLTNKEVYNIVNNDLVGPVENIDYTHTTDNNDWYDLLLSAGEWSFTYDAIGNPISCTNGTTTYTLTWENGRQLTEIKENGSVKAQYTYNQDGIRIEKVADGLRHEYILNGTQIDRELIYDVAGNYLKYDISYFYDARGIISSIYKGEYDSASDTAATYTRYACKTNMQGDVMALYDTSGNLVAGYAYNAWGEQIVYDSTEQLNTSSTFIGNINPFRYRGYYYDNETGFYYLNTRYYDPNICRFINADSYATTGEDTISANMFAYCYNNPVNMTDSLGNMPKWLENAWDKVKGFFIKNFGAYANIEETEEDVLYETDKFSPVHGKIANETKDNIVMVGNQNKPVTFYATGEKTNWLTSSIGVNIQLNELEMVYSLGGGKQCIMFNSDNWAAKHGVCFDGINMRFYYLNSIETRQGETVNLEIGINPTAILYAIIIVYGGIPTAVPVPAPTP